MYQVTLCIGCLIEKKCATEFRSSYFSPISWQDSPGESVGAHGGHYWNDIPMFYADLRRPCYIQMSGEAKKKMFCG